LFIFKHMHIIVVTTHLYFDNGIDFAPAASSTSAIAADSLAPRYSAGSLALGYSAGSPVFAYMSGCCTCLDRLRS
jgi:hypothetical protein